MLNLPVQITNGPSQTPLPATGKIVVRRPEMLVTVLLVVAIVSIAWIIKVIKDKRDEYLLQQQLRKEAVERCKFAWQQIVGHYNSGDKRRCNWTSIDKAYQTIETSVNLHNINFRDFGCRGDLRYILAVVRNNLSKDCSKPRVWPVKNG